MGIHFRSSTRYIDLADVRFLNRVKAVLHGLAGHDFISIGTGIHMTVSTSQIAHFPDIDLENLDFSGPEGIETDFIQPLFKPGELASCLTQRLNLNQRIGKLMMNRLQRFQRLRGVC